jgi:hypothetical protein
VCRIFGHQRVTTKTTHPVGLDTIAVRIDCTRCHRTISSWPKPLGERSGPTQFSKPDPVLPVTELNNRAWSLMCQRQERLAIDKVRSRSERAMLIRLEDRAAIKAARRCALGRLESNSLVVRHRSEVKRRLDESIPMFSDFDERTRLTGARNSVRYRSRARGPDLISFTVGWGTWFRNRQTGLRLLRFRLRTLKALH